MHLVLQSLLETVSGNLYKHKLPSLNKQSLVQLLTIFPAFAIFIIILMFINRMVIEGK